MLKISVVMAVYNGEKYISEQLYSLENQTLPPDELIIIDDGSSDSTVKITKDFIKASKLNIRFFENEKNLGYFENFKKAMSMITGDICLLCDQDDIWESDKIRKIAAIFDDSSVFGCAAGFTFIDKNGDVLKNGMLKEGVFAFVDSFPKTETEKISLSSVAHRNIAPGCACAYRKPVIDVFLNKSCKKLPHDHQLSLLAAAMDSFYFYNSPLTKYRIHDENTLGLKPLEQTRLDIAAEKSALGEVVCGVSSVGKKYGDVSKKRYENLRDKRFFKMLLLVFSPDYRKFYSLREGLGDLLYAVKR